MNMPTVHERSRGNRGSFAKDRPRGGRGLRPQALAVAGVVIWAAMSPMVQAAVPAFDRSRCDSGLEGDLAYCKAHDLHRLEVVLAIHYHKALVSAEPTDADSDFQHCQAELVLAALKASEIAWRADRDQTCQYLGLYEGANAWVNIFTLDCQMEQTRARIKFLSHEGG